MIAYCPTMESSFRLPVRESAGVSDEAQKLEKLSEEAVDHFLAPKLDLLLPEIESLLATADETPVDSDTIFAAKQFAYCLPRFGPLPEVSADPDGEISFDWLGPSSCQACAKTWCVPSRILDSEDFRVMERWSLGVRDLENRPCSR